MSKRPAKQILSFDDESDINGSIDDGIELLSFSELNKKNKKKKAKTPTTCLSPDTSTPLQHNTNVPLEESTVLQTHSEQTTLNHTTTTLAPSSQTNDLTALPVSAVPTDKHSQPVVDHNSNQTNPPPQTKSTPSFLNRPMFKQRGQRTETTNIQRAAQSMAKGKYTSIADDIVESAIKLNVQQAEATDRPIRPRHVDQDSTSVVVDDDLRGNRRERDRNYE